MKKVIINNHVFEKAAQAGKNMKRHMPKRGRKNRRRFMKWARQVERWSNKMVEQAYAN